MSTAYDGDIPGLTGTHYGGDGIGISGALCSASGAFGASSIIRAVENFDPLKEYRLSPAGVNTPNVTMSESGQGQGVPPGGAHYYRLYVDGVEA